MSDLIRLTEDEWRVLDHLTAAHNAFAALPEHHPNDLSEWAQEVHHLQHRVMSRAAIRAQPERFTPLVPSASVQPLEASDE